MHSTTTLLGLVAQSVTSLTADLEVASSNADRPHTFLDIDREIISMAILLLPLIQEGLFSVTVESMYMKY